MSAVGLKKLSKNGDHASIMGFARPRLFYPNPPHLQRDHKTQREGEKLTLSEASQEKPKEAEAKVAED